MDNQTIEVSLQLIRDSIWNIEHSHVTNLDNAEKVIQFLQDHSITALPGNQIKYLSMPEAVYDKWNYLLFKQLYIYTNYTCAQNCILREFQKNKIQAVVIKGTSASQYYPIPEYRTVGDIDLLVKQNDFYRAKKVLLENGYVETNPDKILDRHITFIKGRICIELHWRFASENVILDPVGFDRILFDNIELGRFVLDEYENGLVLLEHIAQHLNGGIGLRQIIDWMLFVNNSLKDDEWESGFCDLAEETGLKNLAVCVTRMCQMYLGLTENDISWCESADEMVCQDFMDYIMHCGDFGHIRDTLDSGVITKIPRLSHPLRFFHYVQKHGEISWKLSKKHPFIKPVAWIYQLLKYIKMVRASDADGERIRKMYAEAERRRKMFSKLGIHIKQG